MQLQNRAHYHFDPTSPSLYRGLCFIIDRTSTGFALYTPEQWARPWSDPHLVVDGRGRILERGAWTGYTAEVLVPVLETHSDPVAEQGDLGLQSRLHRCDHGARCVPTRKGYPHDMRRHPLGSIPCGDPSDVTRSSW